MEPRELQDLLASLLLDAARPEIAVVRVLPSTTLKVLMLDGSAIFVSVAHLGRAGETPPDRPGWPLPHVPDNQQDMVPVGAGPAGSMRPSYLAGLVQHLLKRAGHPAITGVQSFAEVGAVGGGWPPCGIRVELAGGRAAYLSVAKASAAGGVPIEQLPEVLAVP